MKAARAKLPALARGARDGLVLALVGLSWVDWSAGRPTPLFVVPLASLGPLHRVGRAIRG